MSVPASAPLPAEATPALSLKALGKRREVSPEYAPAPSIPPADAPIAAPVAAQVNKTREGERRVTRSSLGGAGAAPDANTASTGGGWTLELPLSTKLHLTTQPPADLVHHPAPTATEAASVTAVSTPAVPQFRLLQLEDTFGGRSRHAGAAETDTSDAYYQRLHRFPEVLEKRGARLERDRLIHERSKLISELEELRGRGWVYIGAQGGKGEEERKRKIKEGEEKLKRYDYLLPNQPRKSGMLNLGSHAIPAAPSSAGSRAASPILAAPPATSSRHRHSTPLFASSGDGGTTIRIKFGSKADGVPTKASTPPRFAGRGPARLEKRTKYADADDDDDDESELSELESSDADEDMPQVSSSSSTAYFGQGGRTQAQYRKRDRKAEKERAAQRVRLGLPSRAKLDGHTFAPPPPRSQPTTFSRVSAIHLLRPPVQSEEDSEDDEAFTSRNRPPTVSKCRQRDSFFASEALREAVFPSNASASAKSSRRSSGRVSYAFGQKVTDSVFGSSETEFRLVGGIDGPANGQKTLEELVKERQGEDDQKGVTVVNGVEVPSSEAMAVLLRAQPAHAHHPSLALAPPLKSPELVAPSDETAFPLVLAVAPNQHGTRGIRKSVVTKTSRGGTVLNVRLDGG